MNQEYKDRTRLTPEEKEALRFEQEQRRHAQEAGCFGLVNGVAFSVQLRKDTEAEVTEHTDGPFICRGCLGDAVLRKCTEKRDHFAHHSRLSPIIDAGETELHKGCLREISDALSQRFPNGKWGTNREIPANEELGTDKVVPDISGRIGDKRLVIEAQVSSLSIPQIINRSQVYAKRKIPILWIVPLKEPLGSVAFRPRLFER